MNLSPGPVRRVAGRPLALSGALVILLAIMAGGAGDAAAQANAGNAARLELRIAELESQIRTMTGQIERLSFDLRQANDRLQRAMTDTEYRLSVLEGNPPGEGPASGAATSAAPVQPSGGAAPATAGSAAGQATGEAGQTQVLGTLSRQGSADGAAPAQGQQQAAAAAPSNPEGDIASQYNAAFALLQERDFQGAEAAFSGFVADHGDHTLASNAQYWIGESFYARGQFKEAASAFALGYQQYPEGSKALDSLVKLGMTFGAMGQREDACSTFGQISREFPAAPQGVRRRISQELDRLQCG